MNAFLLDKPRHRDEKRHVDRKPPTLAVHLLGYLPTDGNSIHRCDVVTNWCSSFRWSAEEAILAFQSLVRSGYIGHLTGSLYALTALGVAMTGGRR